MIIKRKNITVGLDFSFFAVSVFFLSGEMRDNYICALIFSLMHEIGHLAAIKIFGGRIKGFSLGLSGIKIEKSHGELSYHGECITALCGPVVNLVFALVFCALKSDNDSYILPFYINIGLFIVNMLPMSSLDGGRFLRYMLLEVADEEMARKVTKICESAVLVILVTVLVFSLVFDFVNTSFVFFVLSLSIMTVFDLMKS